MKKYIFMPLILISLGGSFAKQARSEDSPPSYYSCLAIAYTMGLNQALAVSQAQIDIIQRVLDGLDGYNYELSPLSSLEERFYGPISGLNLLGNTNFEVSAEVIAIEFYKYLENNRLGLSYEFMYPSIKIRPAYGVRDAEFMISLGFPVIDERDELKVVNLQYYTKLVYDTCDGPGYTPGPRGVVVLTDESNELIFEIKTTDLF